MHLRTVIDNLKNTIAGKELMLDNLNHYTGGDPLVTNVTKNFLTLNINELKTILRDLDEITQ